MLVKPLRRLYKQLRKKRSGRQGRKGKIHATGRRVPEKGKERKESLFK